jgi:GNAT superfamily N-acetyltransferase
MTADNPHLFFRLATTEDAAPLERLINAAFRNDPTDEVFLSPDHASVDVVNISMVQSSIERPDWAVLVATIGDPLIPSSLVAHCIVRKKGNGRAWLGLLAVAPSHQNRRIGSQLVTFAERYARQEWGSRRMEFNVVNTRAGLISWYTQRGYQLTGETEPFPYEHHADSSGVLRDDLHLVLMGKDLAESTAA